MIFDKTNIILLATAALLVVLLMFLPVSAVWPFPFALAVVLIAYIRSVYLISGKNAAILMSLIILLIPLVLSIVRYTLTTNTTASNMIGKLLPWILVVFAVLLGIGILYTIAKIGIAIALPEASNKIETSFILRDAKRHFSFLLEKGYKISHVDYVNHPLGGWNLQIESPDSEISITLDQQEGTRLTFGKESRDNQYQIFLEAMIYHLSMKKDFICYPVEEITLSRSQRFLKIAKLLKRYINQIESYLRSDFEKSKNELSNLQEEYITLLIQDTQRRRESRK